MNRIYDLTWDQTRPGIYETQAHDGSIWRYNVGTGEVHEVTDIHPRNRIGNASMRSLATKEVQRLIDA
jgi:hypothetical protein